MTAKSKTKPGSDTTNEPLINSVNLQKNIPRLEREIPKLVGNVAVGYFVNSLPPASVQFYMLLCFALGVLLCAKCLLSLIFPAWSGGRYVEIWSSFFAIIMASLLSLEASANGIQGLVVFPFAIMLVAGHLWGAFLRCRQSPFLPRQAPWVVATVTIAATVWCYERLFEGHLRLEMERIKSIRPLMLDLEPVPQYVAVTDRGREVKVFRWVINLMVDSDGTVVLPAEDEHANCHGWVFAEGAYYLRKEDVEQILKDNGYQPCTTPQSGDLIVYRNPDGAISHTGVVQMGVLGKAAIIESKWGLLGRYTHPAELQPFGNRYNYYRSARQGHSLAILASQSVPARVANR